MAFDDFTIKRENPDQNIESRVPGKDRLIMEIMAKTFRYQEPEEKDMSTG